VSNCDAALLVVDDIEDNRFALSRRLARQGYLNVTTVADGRQALEVLKSKPFDLVLLDIMMPNVNGYQVLAEMKEDHSLRHIPVVMISAVDEIDSVARCIELGAEDYLPKPFNPTLLRARVGACLERKRLHDQIQARTRELTEALEQQTAISEVLQVISRSPGDLEPVFKRIMENATRLCEAKFGTINFFDRDQFRIVAEYNVPPAFTANRLRQGPFCPHPTSGHANVVRTKQVVHIEDLTTTPPYREGDPAVTAMANLGGARTIAVVPMLQENDLLGTITVFRQEVRPFTDKQIQLITSFARQAAIAIENARLLNELRQRTDELAHSVEGLQALGEVSQAVNSTLDLETVLSTIVAKAVQLSGTDAGVIYVFDELEEAFHLRASYGLSEELVAAIEDQYRGTSDAIRQATRDRKPQQVADVCDEPPSSVREIAMRAGFRARLIVPLINVDKIVGALVVRRKRPGQFPKDTVDLLQTFAAQSVIAIQNARLFAEIED
jgi:GAF domain-containing protein